MATAFPLPVSRPKPVPANIPASLEAALREGWKVQNERSATSIDDKKRRGVVTLRKAGMTFRLKVSYTATAKAWNFGAPEAIH